MTNIANAARQAGYRVETLGRGSRAGQGLVLREQVEGRLTGRMISWRWSYAMTQAEANLEMLVSATRLLALEPEDQIGAFPEFVVVPDELAQNFADAYLLVDQLLEEELIDQEQARLLGSVDQELGKMTKRGAQELWTTEALRHGREWQDVRATARMALSAFGAELGQASLGGITYVNEPKR